MEQDKDSIEISLSPTALIRAPALQPHEPQFSAVINIENIDTEFPRHKENIAFTTMIRPIPCPEG